MPFNFSSPEYLSHHRMRKNRVSRASPAHMNSPLEEKVCKLSRITIITVYLIIYVGQGLCENTVVHLDVSFVFLRNPPIAILELPNCLSHEWLTFLKCCYWLVRQECNKHVTMKDLISA